MTHDCEEVRELPRDPRILDPDIQPRESLHPDAVTEDAALLRDGAALPPISGMKGLAQYSV